MDKAQEIGLKPCPFCGGNNLRFENCVLEAVVSCRKCKSTLVRRHGNCGYDENGRDEVIEAWNTRTSPIPVPSVDKEMIEDYIADVESGLRYLEYTKQDYGIGNNRLRMKAKMILESLTEPKAEKEGQG